jgi:hypothetical protein
MATGFNSRKLSGQAEHGDRDNRVGDLLRWMDATKEPIERAFGVAQLPGPILISAPWNKPVK